MAIGYIFSVLNVGMVVGGVWGIVAMGKSQCKGKGGYGTIVVLNSVVGIIAGMTVILLHGIFYIKFKSTGKLPFLSPDEPKSN